MSRMTFDQLSLKYDIGRITLIVLGGFRPIVGAILGIVFYVRTAFGPRLEGSVLVPIEPVVTLPFALVWRGDARSAALDAVLAAV